MENADLKNAEFSKKLAATNGFTYGVRMPIIRSIAKEVCKDDWRGFLKTTPESYDELLVMGIVIASARMDIEERLALTKEFLPHIDSWGVCDIFCSTWKEKDERSRGLLWNYCMELIKSGDEFPMRVGSILMLANFIDEEYIERVLNVHSTAYHDGYYFKMGSAWTLSMCYVKFPEKTEKTLFCDTLDVWIRNKTIQKIRESYRVDQESKDRLKEKKDRM